MQKISYQKIRKVGEQIGENYKPEKVILFGSYAWGKPGPDSDVDFFIVKRTKNSFELAREIDSSIFPRPFPLDLLVYTPQQVKQREKLGDFFILDILSKGKILYAR